MTDTTKILYCSDAILYMGSIILMAACYGGIAGFALARFIAGQAMLTAMWNRK